MLTLFLLLTAHAAETYRTPSDVVGRILDAPQPPSVSISPDGRWMVELERPSLPSIEELAEPVVRVAGLKLNPVTNGPAHEYAWRGMGLKPPDSSPATPVTLPDDARIRYADWSREGDRLAFTLTKADGIELWVLDVATAEARKLTGPELNAAYGAPCDWLPGDEGLVCKVIPEDRAAAPAPARVPAGPRSDESIGRKAPARTYTNLLQSPHDEALFEHYLTSRVDLVGLDGTRTPLVETALIDEVSPSPDGRYLLVQTMHRPWSYHVPAARFPRTIEVIDRATGTRHPVDDLALADEVPIAFGSVRTGRREAGWRGDEPATLWFVEALDGGDAAAEAEHRDALSLWRAPFTGKPELLWRSELRFGGVQWGRADVALVEDWRWSDRRTRTWVLDPSSPGQAPRLLFDRSWQDVYADPGSPMSKAGPYGARVLRFTPDGQGLWLTGGGASPDGLHPFLDQLDLRTGATKRVWQSRDPHYERVIELLDDDARAFVTYRQSKEEPPNYQLRTPKNRRGIRPITAYTDPAPELAGLTKQVLHYERADGVQLTGTLYLPPGWDRDRDGPLPTLLWAYPNEYKRKEDAGQVTTTENTFSRPQGSSILFLLLEGYAVLDDPKMPIIGEGDVEPNDTYVEQLVMGAEAAVSHLVALGVADPDRLAIGGHSYGAFTAANLLAHTDLFKAGIARSGAFNRSLTPFGFQGEQRTYWEATEAYVAMSPFTFAHRIDEPLLLLHGAEDSNAGTYPVQSERLYEAIKGTGGRARWVELPFEDHGYRSRESVGHVLWEMTDWLDRWVKEPN